MAETSKAASTLQSPAASATFSSSPVAPVVVNSHNRRQNEGAWPKVTNTSSMDDMKNASNNSNGMANENGSLSYKHIQTGESSGGGVKTGGRRERTTSPSSSPRSYGSDQSMGSDDDMRGRKHKESHAPGGGAFSSLSEGKLSSNGGAPHHRSGMTLPSLSTQLQERHGDRMSTIQASDVRVDETYGSGSIGNHRQYRRSRSRSRERTGSSNDRYPSGLEKEESERPEDDGDSNNSRDGPPSPDEGDCMRIMFHGREIYADDLIGLRVAKTFVGHGRFLGQVVKFDEPTALYTVVYADGDAEELNIENTLQILIQDEIERADPTVQHSMSSLSRRTSVPSFDPDSPDIHSVAPIPSSSQPKPQQLPSPSAPVRRRPLMQISEREAQFVIGLFENHALPILIQKGWKVGPGSYESETRFYPPPGFLSTPGLVLASPLDVVELIASDNELLTACFPTNVHSAILSLLPESTNSSGRKRIPSSQASVDSFDWKRQRSSSSRDEPYANIRMRGSGTTGVSPMHHDVDGNTVPAYCTDGGRDRSRSRDVYASNRFSTLPSRGDGINGNSRSTAHESSEYWAPPSQVGGRTVTGQASASGPENPTDYRGQYVEGPEWTDHALPPSRGTNYVAEYTDVNVCGHGRMGDQRYVDRTPFRPSLRGVEDSPAAYRFRGQGSSPRNNSPQAEAFRHRFPGRDAPSEATALPSRADYLPGEGGDPVGRGARAPGGLVAPRRSAAFSMMDVDRNSNPRASVPPSVSVGAIEQQHSSRDQVLSALEGVQASDRSKWETGHHLGSAQLYDRVERTHSPQPSPAQIYGQQHQSRHHHHHTHHHRHHPLQRTSSNGSSRMSITTDMTEQHNISSGTANLSNKQP